MAIAPFRRVRSQDNVIRQVQDAVGLVFQDITSKALLDGNLLKDVPLSSSAPNTIDHGLNREPLGWIVVRTNGATSVYESTSPTPKASLILYSSADVTASIWVF